MDPHRRCDRTGQIHADEGVDTLDHTQRIAVQVALAHVEHLIGMPRSDLIRPDQRARPLRRFAPDHDLSALLAPSRFHRIVACHQQRHQRGDRLGRVAMHLDDAGIGEDRQEQIEVVDMSRVLEQPAPIRFAAPDQLHAALVVRIGGRLGLCLPPGVVTRRRPSRRPQVGDEALPKQQAAFVDLFGGHGMCGVLDRCVGMAARQPCRGPLELGIVLPGGARRPGAGRLKQPGLQPLEAGIERHQFMKCGRAGARNSGDHHRADDRCIGVVGMLAHRSVGSRAAAQHA
ncbi:bifunctional UGMP family protein/serine/threonine protein kinase [Corchorus olitorius]|uniref:Bifunctional UGMP family protein/serine/threonine protein kinase n=1 Tax=Corchorus olitorius TaxID=93759 RepID=A0A1R3L0R1_9ROSI|nr:bifunctional UGMP family protein/serine/threonine protein kinase [Corchorus olitorius]